MDKSKKSSAEMEDKKIFKVKVTKDGPYLVSGGLPLSKEIIGTDKHGDSVEWKKGEAYPEKDSYSLCRCGRTKDTPYCDGNHDETGFDGTETASREKYVKQAGKITGPDLDLTDAETLCAGARFCHGRKGRVWDLTRESGNPKSKQTAIKQACDCPAGRLVAWDKNTGKAIEPKHVPGISIVEDPKEKVSGPLWLKGGVPVESADGTKYETRNRVTLCRCGKSANKPFCDASHIEAGYNDGDESLKSNTPA
jgi:CDGSH-type Zn-finger protein